MKENNNVRGVGDEDCARDVQVEMDVVSKFNKRR